MFLAWAFVVVLRDFIGPFDTNEKAKQLFVTSPTYITIIIIMNKHKSVQLWHHAAVIIIIIIIIELHHHRQSSSWLPLTHRKQLPRCVSHVSHVTAALLITPACHFTSISSHSASLPSSSSSSPSSTPMIITTTITATPKTIRLQWSLWSSLPHFFGQVETITSRGPASPKCTLFIIHHLNQSTATLLLQIFNCVFIMYLFQVPQTPLVLDRRTQQSDKVKSTYNCVTFPIVSLFQLSHFSHCVIFPIVSLLF